MSQWQPQQYDPTAHQERLAPQGGHTPPGPQHRRRSRAPLITVAALAILAAGGGAAYALTSGSSPAPAKALTCKQQYDTWKTGPAKGTATAIAADGNALSASGNTEDITVMVSALKKLGTDAGAAQAYPMPSCADPGGYWSRELSLMKAAGDNAGTASGLGAVLLAEAPLRQIPALQQKLTAELEKAAATGRG